MEALILKGKVIAIEPYHDPARRKRWLVTLHVEKVIAGKYTGDTFAFPIHSPTKSGLTDGGHYTVRIEPAADGYRVDELQWLPGRE